LSACGFTQAAEDFALKTIKRIEKEMKPGTEIYIGGCLPKINKAKNIIKEIKHACPDLKCGTSLIVGFPGETEENFNETIDACKELRFDYIYCHSYSDRKGTEAEKLPNKIPGDIILQRARTLKTELKSITSLITIAEDTAGNLTCQG
jgi:tRNA A37 methylthiotransferase MiaB